MKLAAFVTLALSVLPLLVSARDGVKRHQVSVDGNGEFSRSYIVANPGDVVSFELFVFDMSMHASLAHSFSATTIAMGYLSRPSSVPAAGRLEALRLDRTSGLASMHHI